MFNYGLKIRQANLAGRNGVDSQILSPALNYMNKFTCIGTL